MNVFYHNVNWQPLHVLMPELVRSRYLSLPQTGQRKIYRLTIRHWLLECSTVETHAAWRLSPDEPWKPDLPGEIRLFKPNTYLEERQGDGPQTSGIMLYFNHGETAGLDQLFAPNRPHLALNYRADIVQRARDIAIMGSKHGESVRPQAQLKLYEILTLITDQCHKDSRQLQRGTLSDNVNQFLKRHLNSPVTRQQIADAIHVSVSTLSHRYMAETGLTPQAKHLQLRLEQAANILLENTSIQTTADLLGFSSPSHLATAFKKHFRQTVQQYRQTHPLA